MPTVSPGCCSTPAELRSLGLGRARSQAVAEKLGKAMAGFKALLAGPKALAEDATWVQFGASRPGIVPAGTDQSTRDVRVYENVTAIFESGGKQGQLQIGTLVQVGDVWRLIDAPHVMGDGQADAAAGGFFFQASVTVRGEGGGPGPSETSQKLLSDLQDLDRDAARAATPVEQARYTGRRADLLDQIAEAAKTADERAMWFRQLADMLSAAVQSGAYPEGAERLNSLFAKLERNNADKNLAAYVKFRQLTAAYFRAMQAPKADFAKVQAEWLKTLENYIAQYPTAARLRRGHAPVGHQPGVYRARGRGEAVVRADRRRVPQRAGGPEGGRGAGPAGLGGQGHHGPRPEPAGEPHRPGQLPRQGGADPVLGHLVRAGQERHGHAQGDVEQVRPVAGHYRRQSRQQRQRPQRLPGREPAAVAADFRRGGLDSRPANALGILTVPTMILVDQEGKVVKPAVSIVDLETELKKLIR